MNQKLEAVLLERKLGLSLAIAKIISSFLVALSFTIMILCLPVLILMAVVEYLITTVGLVAVIFFACAYFLIG